MSRREHDTDLIHAVRNGRAAEVSSLLASGDSVDEPKTDGSGITALFVAADQGHVDIVSALLAAGATVDKSDDEGGTPLYFACQEGHALVVSQLIAAGAAVARADYHGVTALLVASQNGHTAVVAELLAAGSASVVNDATHAGATPLLIACQEGHADVVTSLLAAGAAIDQAANDGASPLCIACAEGHAAIASTLCAAGAAVNRANDNGLTPMCLACIEGHLECVQALSSYGASRTATVQGTAFTAEEVATEENHPAIAAWLAASWQWSTPLHHLSIIDTTRARALLRGGADVRAAAAAGGPTPLSLAQKLDAAGEAPDGSAAHLVLKAARPWSPANHVLFPAAARARAVTLMRIGFRFSRLPRYETVAGGLFELWVAHVMPHAVARESE